MRCVNDQSSELKLLVEWCVAVVVVERNDFPNVARREPDARLHSNGNLTSWESTFLSVKSRYTESDSGVVEQSAGNMMGRAATIRPLSTEIDWDFGS